MVLLPGAGVADLRRLTGLVTKVPSFELESGTDLVTIPGVISRLLQDLAGS
jgi:hypothetical protein